MACRIKVHEIELSQPLKDLTDLDGYSELHILLRWQAIPLGQLRLPVDNDRCSASTLNAAITKTHKHKLVSAQIRRRLNQPVDPSRSLQMPCVSPDTDSESRADEPLVTVAVCTRDRTQHLKNCLSSLNKLTYSNIEVLVVDNAPATDETKRLVRESFADFRYVNEPRPGLDWARNRAVEQASGEIIAYTDDDVVVDPSWVDALVNVFQEDSAVMAVTGLVLAHELETPAQIYFERYGGFGRGFRRQWFTLDNATRLRQNFHIGAGRFGTGANMAFRRQVFDEIGVFDPALDVGTVTNGGGDLEMYFRVLGRGPYAGL